MMNWQPYLKKHFHFTAFNAGSEDTDISLTPNKKRGAWVIALLKLVPWVCLAMLIAGYVWPTTGHLTVWPGVHLPLTGILEAVAMGGLIGYLTNWLAIKMLFHPREKRPLLGQGLIPAQRELLAIRLAGSIHTHILNEDILLERLHQSQIIPRLFADMDKGMDSLAHDAAFQLELSQTLGNALADYLRAPEQRDRLVELLDDQIRAAAAGKTLPSLYLKLNPKGYKGALEQFADALPENLNTWLDVQLPQLLRKLSDGWKDLMPDAEQHTSKALQWAASKVRIEKMLVDQIKGFETAKLEDMLWGSTNQQLLYIQYLGGLLGMLGGLVLWQPLFAGGVLAVCTGLLWGTDALLFRMRRAQ